MKKFSFSHVQWLRTAGRHLYNKEYFILQQSLIFSSNRDGKRGTGCWDTVPWAWVQGWSFMEVYIRAVLQACEAYLSRNCSRVKCLQEAVCRLYTSSDYLWWRKLWLRLTSMTSEHCVCSEGVPELPHHCVTSAKSMETCPVCLPTALSCTHLLCRLRVCFSRMAINMCGHLFQSIA